MTSTANSAAATPTITSTRPAPICFWGERSIAGSIRTDHCANGIAMRRGIVGRLPRHGERQLATRRGGSIGELYRRRVCALSNAGELPGLVDQCEPTGAVGRRIE